MDENLIPLGERSRSGRSFWPFDLLKLVLPDLFWFVVFPLCLFAYRATVPLAGIYLMILIWHHGVRGSLNACRIKLASTPLLVWLSLGLGMAALGWTADPAGAAKVLGAEVLPVTVLAFALLALVGRETSRVSPYVLATSLILTSFLLMIELRTGMILHAYLGLQQKAPRLNQSVMIISLALFPVLYMLRHHRWLAVLTALVVAVMVAISTKSAAKLGFVIAAIGYGFYYIWPVLTRWLVFGTGVLATLTSPWWGVAVFDIVTRLEAAGLLKASATDRLPILKSFGEAVLQSPWIGYGFNGSFSMIGDPRFPQATGDLKYGFMQGHPHNLFLQVFVETGLLGCAVMLGLLGLLLGAIARLEHGLRSAAGAFLIFNLSVLAVSHGAWQAWWWAADLLAVVLFVAQSRVGHQKGSQG